VIDERPVPRAQPVVPHTRRHVGAHVGVELGLLDRTVRQVVVPPAAVGALGVDQPLVGALGLVVEPATSSAIAVSTWFHGSQCPPTNHGIIPVSSCRFAMASALWCTSSPLSTPSR
jgi:hypothetical protein